MGDLALSHLEFPGALFGQQAFYVFIGAVFYADIFLAFRRLIGIVRQSGSALKFPVIFCLSGFIYSACLLRVFIVRK